MNIKSNLHTHTPYCDGKSTIEEIILGAIDKGFESIGFSGHSYTDFEPEPSMNECETERYIKDIYNMKEKYKGQIEIYLGIEQDVYSPKPQFKPDYIIGSVHYLKMGEDMASVDGSEERAKDAVDRYFSGDWLAFAEKYYETARMAAEITNADIIGHFDLVTKFNEGNKYFDENHIRYRTAAIDALRYEIEHCNLFEVNTGAIYRKKRGTPYPAEFLLREINRLGGEIIFSSDSHDANSLGYRFPEAVEIAKKCGFVYAKVLKNGIFEDVKL